MMKRQSLRALVGLVSFLVLFGLAAYVFSNIIVYFVISLIIATLLRPLVARINSIQFLGLRMPRVLAVFISFGVLLGLVFLFISMFIPLIADQIEVISSINFDALLNRLSEPIINVERFLIESKVMQQEPGFFMQNLLDGSREILANIKVNALLNSIISITGNVSVGIIAVTFISFFLLYEKGLLRKQIINLIPNGYFEVSIAALSKIENLLSKYLIGLLFQMLAIFSLASVGLSLVGVNYALVISVFAAVANLIPYAGPILGASFGVLVSISTDPVAFGTPEFYFLILKILAVFSVVQVTDNILLQPLIFSRSVKVHPLEIFVIIFAGATLAGIPGMIAAIPVYTILRVSVMEFVAGYKAYRIFKI